MKTVPTILFILYLLILMKLILFKGTLFYQVVPTSEEYISSSSDSTLVSVNLVPLRTIKGYLNSDVSSTITAFNILGNIALFIPYGFLLPFVFKRRLILFDIFYTALLLSLSFELTQFLTHTGQFDVDDIILNTTGGITGYLLLKLFEEIKERKEIRKHSRRRKARR